MRPMSATPPPADRVEALLRGAADQGRRRTTDDEIIERQQCRLCGYAIKYQS
ncbi:hypothetical protein [Austwickia sp. TVS 96-490-7B]|uniref:hypothetical protein n=1 Tax=Austwickia sp. TVS 96-490-7B TaxID=2830843 RepID=UPI001C56415D|nr:hypothetical protein [Austwickia sp. TVS 96-490-7B]